MHPMAFTEPTAVIVNPRSAHGRTRKHLPYLQYTLEERLAEPLFLVTESPGHATALVRDALWRGYTRIISVGGDGTHFEVVNGFFDGARAINPDAVLVVLPFGTGSDLARTLSIPKGRRSLDFVTSQNVIRADVGRITCTMEKDRGEVMNYFMSTCRIGIGGEVVDLVNAQSKAYGGFLTYLWGTLQALWRYRDKPMEIWIDGLRIQQVVKELVLANGQYDGGGMHVAPNAQLDDGLFDIYVIGPIGLADALLNLPKIYRGQLRKRPDVVKYFRGRVVKVSSPECVKIQTDGEKPGVLPATVEILPKAIRVVTGAAVVHQRMLAPVEDKVAAAYAGTPPLLPVGERSLLDRGLG